MTKLTRFTDLENVPLKENVETTGNPNDEGRWKSLIDEQSGSKDLRLGIGWMKPGEVHLLHHHTVSSEFYYFLDGSASVTVGTETAKVRAGTAVYIPVGEKHKIVNVGDTDLVVLFGYNKLNMKSIYDE